MPSRADAIAAFLQREGRDGWHRSLLAGDASNRRYDRLRDPATDRTEILMDADPVRGEDVAPFVAIARHLRAIGLAAPEILAEDRAQGFLLIEDFGDALLARLAAQDPRREIELYRQAADVLLALHRHPPPPGLPRLAAPMPAEFLALAHGWYRPGATGALPDEAGAAADLVNRALADHAQGPPVLILRDFHAENLVWRANREGTDRIGLLDFQDAMAGHPAYDLVSLLEDARRDIAPATRDATLAHFIGVSGADPAAFMAAFSTLGAQRNLRIIGVFARLGLHHGKTRYIDLIPRVWGHLMGDLDHPALADLRQRVVADLPAPDPAYLTELKARCVHPALP